MGLYFGRSRSSLDRAEIPYKNQKALSKENLEDVIEKYFKTGNPNPDNYEIEYSYEQDKWLLLIINYPNCSNFEGRKVLLFKNTSRSQIEKQKLIDPHFSDNSNYIHPIARFEPSEEGISLAFKLIVK